MFPVPAGILFIATIEDCDMATATNTLTLPELAKEIRHDRLVNSQTISTKGNMSMARQIPTDVLSAIDTYCEAHGSKGNYEPETFFHDVVRAGMRVMQSEPTTE